MRVAQRMSHNVLFDIGSCHSNRYVGRLHASGFLKEGEAQKILCKIQGSMLELYACPLSHSEDEMEAAAEKKSS